MISVNETYIYLKGYVMTLCFRKKTGDINVYCHWEYYYCGIIKPKVREVKTSKRKSTKIMKTKTMIFLD